MLVTDSDVRRPKHVRKFHLEIIGVLCAEDNLELARPVLDREVKTHVPFS